MRTRVDPVPGAAASPEAAPAAHWRSARWPWLVVAAAVVFNLWVLRAEALTVRYPNDAAVHRSMVAWAEDRFRAGHLPLDGWYPDLALGSSRFHHYQSLPHVLGGLVALGIGSEAAIAWSTYLLLSLWPIAVYAGGRLLGWGPGPSALAALASPLVVSQPGLGYEYGSYIWRGYGTWTQLWGMWFLPLAWGLGWRAVHEGRRYATAALVLALTIAVHLLTGYLALLSLGVFVLVAPRDLARRLLRAATVGIGSLVVAAWVVWPLLADRAWTIQDEFSRGKPFYDSFGASQVMRWFVSGEIFDRWRFPVLTILVAAGALVCLWRFRREPRARALLGLGLLALLLFFGRPTLGSALRLLPGSGDLFLRRFVFGVHLAGLYLIGLALSRSLRVLREAVRRWWRRPVTAPALGVAAAVLIVAVLAPAWVERGRFAELSGRWIREQRTLDHTEGADVAELVEIARGRGPGRFYAGMRSNWGATYRVGQVPMYAVLLSESAEAIGFTRPTWSLSSPVEYRFSDRNPVHYDLFGVRYLILADDRPPPVPAEEVARRGDHVLWEVPTDGYVEIVDVLPAIRATRTDLGVQVAPWLRSGQPAEGAFPAIAFEGRPAAPPTPGSGPRGRVLSAEVDLRDGEATAVVDLARPAMVLLKTSFDPRWQVTVDGRPAEPQMIAPSFVGRVVSEGRHRVTFTYEPFPRYDVLLLLAPLALLALALVPRLLRERSAGGVVEPPSTPVP